MFTVEEALKRQLENGDSRIIVTTIQKLSVFIKKYPGHDVFQKHIVIIFDEFKKADKEVIADIRRAVSASASLRNKRDLIEAFIASLNPDADSVVDEWLAFVKP